MKYKIIETTDSLTGVKAEHIFITFDDGSTKSIPAVESNSEYQEFLNQIEAK